MKTKNNYLIFMSDNRIPSTSLDGSDYNTLTAIINLAYAKRHGYDFRYYVPKLGSEYTLYNNHSVSGELRHVSWTKLLTTIKILEAQPDYDGMVYIDSDCIVSKQSLTIDQYLSGVRNTDGRFLDKTKLLYFLNDIPYSSTLPCAGFYIIKNDKRLIKLFKDWYACEHNVKTSYEQKSLRDDILDVNLDKIEIINDVMFLKKPAQFLRHVGSDEKHNRMSVFKDYLENFDKDYIQTLLKELQNYIIEYETE